MRAFLLVALVSLLLAGPSAATVWVERRVPETVSAEAIARVEQAACELRTLLDVCESKRVSLPDEPGEDCRQLLTALDEGWNAYIRTMWRWGYIDESRDWMKPFWRAQVCLFGWRYSFFGLSLPEERAHPKPLLASIMLLMRAELEGSQREHMECVRRLQEPAPWEVEDAPSLWEIPPLLP